MTTLTAEELKEVLRLTFNKGLEVGRKQKPLNEIPMGSVMINPVVEFDKFIKETFGNLEKKK